MGGRSWPPAYGRLPAGLRRVALRAGPGPGENGHSRRGCPARRASAPVRRAEYRRFDAGTRRRSSVTAQLLSADLAGKPAALNALADRLDRHDPFAALPALVEDEPAGILLLGTGSARQACAAAAFRMRLAGLSAVAEFPSAEATLPPGPATLVVAVDVGGGVRELCTA